MAPYKVIACMLSEDVMERLRGRYSVSVRHLRAFIPDEDLREAHAVVTTPYDRIDAVFLDRAPNLKIIAQFGVGTDNIDLEAAQARGVVVTHTPGVVVSATAEMALALMLMVSRRFKEAEGILGRGPEAMPLGFELSGKTLGIIGMGQIGAAVARRAHAFGMKIYYANRRRANPTIERETTAARRTQEELFEISDVLSLHCNLNADSRHLVHAASFERMKNSAVLINTARAEVVDEVALAHALTSGQIWGAGLDVFSSDLPEVIRCHPRVVLTPHSGTATTQTREAMSNLVVDSIAACITQDDRIPNRKI
ncbi:MAG: D-glycerate dehydrogenase [Rhodothermaceae bacterium]|nr:D-glycerate dehydrogenase [Rhodothermaceae bacterium]